MKLRNKKPDTKFLAEVVLIMMTCGSHGCQLCDVTTQPHHSILKPLYFLLSSIGCTILINDADYSNETIERFSHWQEEDQKLNNLVETANLYLFSN